MSGFSKFVSQNINAKRFWSWKLTWIWHLSRSGTNLQFLWVLPLVILKCRIKKNHIVVAFSAIFALTCSCEGNTAKCIRINNRYSYEKTLCCWNSTDLLSLKIKISVTIQYLCNSFRFYIELSLNNRSSAIVFTFSSWHSHLWKSSCIFIMI